MARGKRSYPSKTFHADSGQVFGASAFPRASLSRAVGEGRLRRIGRGLYTTNLDDPIDEITERHRFEIAGILFPGAVIGDRSAVNGGQPLADGSLFLIAASDREVRLGRISFRARRGPAAHAGDMPYPGGVHLAGTARALLENARPSRARSGRSARTLSRRELEEWIERLLDNRGETGLLGLRDEARALAPELGLEREFELVDQLIGAVLGTRRVAAASPLLRARQRGRAYDAARLELFALLRDELEGLAPRLRPADPEDPKLRFLPFFEAYFSNFIEGTEFPLEQAREIVFENYVPAGRPLDAHDITGTYALVADLDEMRHLPRDADEYLELLLRRHARMMEARTETAPGQFKTEPNRAGSSWFVKPDRVPGTLVRGFEHYATLTDSFQRAVFQMFLVSEVHPFADGNGRLARVMMNAELVASGEQRIIIPQVFRNDYIAALKALTANRRTEPLVRTLDFAQRYTQALDFSSFERARAELEASNAFLDPVEAENEGLRLRIPAQADGA